MLRAHAGLFPSAGHPDTQPKANSASQKEPRFRRLIAVTLQVGYCQGMNFVAGFLLLVAGRVPDASKAEGGCTLGMGAHVTASTLKLLRKATLCLV